MLSLWLSTAFAAEIYVNGTRADVMPAITMENVTVRFDTQGNCWIDAPMYKISVVPSLSAVSSPAPAPAYTPPAYTPPAAVPTPAYSSPARTYPPLPPAPVPAAPTYDGTTSLPTSSYGAAAYVAPLGVAAGSWWLVTEDNDSSGQAIDIKINGNEVRRVRSGEGQVIIDIGAFLRRGANTVEITALPGSYGGGLLAVYLGKGSDSGGTVRMDTPAVKFARRSTDSTSGTVKEYTLTVP